MIITWSLEGVKTGLSHLKEGFLFCLNCVLSGILIYAMICTCATGKFERLSLIEFKWLTTLSMPEVPLLAKIYEETRQESSGSNRWVPFKNTGPMGSPESDYDTCNASGSRNWWVLTNTPIGVVAECSTKCVSYFEVNQPGIEVRFSTVQTRGISRAFLSLLEKEASPTK